MNAIAETYKIGSATLEIALPSLIQIPNCDYEFSIVTDELTAQGLDLAKIETAVIFDSTGSVLKVFTNDNDSF